LYIAKRRLDCKINFYLNVSAKSASGVEDLFMVSASVGILTAAERLEENMTNSVSNN